MPETAPRVHIYDPPAPPLLGVDDLDPGEGPPPVEPFTHPDLAADPVCARRARDHLDTLTGRVSEVIFRQMEPVERALRLAEPDSPLAAELRAHVRAALAGAETALIALDHATLALHRAAPDAAT